MGGADRSALCSLKPSTAAKKKVRKSAEVNDYDNSNKSCQKSFKRSAPVSDDVDDDEDLKVIKSLGHVHYVTQFVSVFSSLNYYLEAEIMACQ